MSLPIMADEIKFGFKNPSFSGIGTGAHYLTIENQEFSRKKLGKRRKKRRIRQKQVKQAQKQNVDLKHLKTKMMILSQSQKVILFL